MNSIQRQGGNMAPMSCFSSAILVGESGQHKFEGINVWVAGRLVVVFWNARIIEQPFSATF